MNLDYSTNSEYEKQFQHPIFINFFHLLKYLNITQVVV